MWRPGTEWFACTAGACPVGTSDGQVPRIPVGAAGGPLSVIDGLGSGPPSHHGPRQRLAKAAFSMVRL